jgi:signal transduction histidine kinase/HAMP domain-containing protein
VVGTLLTSGLVEIYFSYREHRTALARVEQEKALAAASLIEQFVKEIERQVVFLARFPWSTRAMSPGQRRFEYRMALSRTRAITELGYLDASGHEQLRVSRFVMDAIGSEVDWSRDPKFLETRSGRTYFSPVYFRMESEPYMTVAVAGADGRVVFAEVNLKLMWETVSDIRVGTAGYAYVVDSDGRLIAHPDISLVLQKTDLSDLPHVRAAESALRQPAEDQDDVVISRDLHGREILTSRASVAPLGWMVFVEQPIEETFAPLRTAITRSAAVLLLGICVALLASISMARRMVAPIRRLQEGAARVGKGELAHRIDIHTGDEVEALAQEFNRTAARLQESYGILENSVEERTRDLSQALERQAAISDILRILSTTPGGLDAVLEAVATSAARLCSAPNVAIYRVEGDLLRRLVARDSRSTRSSPGETRRISRGSVAGRAVLDRNAVHVADLAAVRETEFPEEKENASARRRATVLAVPMLQKGQAIGAIMLTRGDILPFSESQIELVTTFADQAVVAVENVRLFQELRDRTEQLKARTEELSRSVDELRALGEISDTMNSSLDYDTVLSRIVLHAVHLSGADAGTIYEFDAPTRMFVPRASNGLDAEMTEALRDARIPLSAGALGRAATLRRPVQLANLSADPSHQPGELFGRGGFHAVLVVPLLREDLVVGGLVIRRRTPGEFPRAVVELLQRFTAQSVLAIQNARLFREIAAKSRELEVASQHKSQFLANMSHELRTPLNAIIGFSDVLLEKMFGEMNAKQESYIRNIHASGKHLLSLINDILDLSKIEAGRMELELSQVHVPSALQNALMLIRERAQRQHIALSCLVDPQVGEIAADERKFKQIMLNLLSNAVKFTPQGGSVDVHARLLDDHLEVSVRDTGVGIAQADQAAAFEEFRQVGRHYSARQEGTGLGLALTRRFVELHGGSIRLQSELGKGSIFTITLPVRQ